MRQIAKTLPAAERLALRALTSLALATGLAVATMGLAQAQAMPATGDGMQGRAMTHGPKQAAHHPHGGHGGMMMSERMLDSVGASAEQKTRVREILKAAQDEQHQQREAGQALRQQMMALMAAPQIDAAAAEALRQQQQARRDAASKRMLQAMLDVHAVLTPEQRAKMAETMKSRQEMMGRSPA